MNRESTIDEILRIVPPRPDGMELARKALGELSDEELQKIRIELADIEAGFSELAGLDIATGRARTPENAARIKQLQEEQEEGMRMLRGAASASGPGAWRTLST